MTDDDVLAYVQRRLGHFVPVEEPVRLPEGNLNRVWRVNGVERSVIVKYAPPYIAADPDTPLDPDRLLIEARCLAALSPDGLLSDLATDTVRPPRPLDMNTSEKVLIMEDVGSGPTVARWVQVRESSSPSSSSIGRALGTFVGRLHGQTYGDEIVAQRFDNPSMQETRQSVQYGAVATMLDRGGIDDAAELGARAEDLGERLLEPGRCLTMGDLWPPSVLMAGSDLRIIDWELAHYGRPLQDVAHWLAHLWMQEHRADQDSAGEIRRLRHAFLDGYEEAMGPARASLWTEHEKRDAAIHFGAEILVRSVGPFQDGYVYAGLSPESHEVQEAVTVAARTLRHPGETDLLSDSEPS